jgi:hypothetical protein
MFGSFLPSLRSSNNHSLLGSRSRHCYAIKSGADRPAERVRSRIIVHAMIDLNTVHVARGIGLFLLYAFIFWRLFRDYRGNRVIQCGSITLMLFMVMLALTRIPKVPLDYVAWLGPALFLLCMLTLFFLFQQGYRALRKRFKGRSGITM